MAGESYEDARRIWQERKLPVLVKPLAGKLKIRFPKDLMQWPFLIRPRQHVPQLLEEKLYWEVPRARFDNLIGDLLALWDATYVIQHYTERKVCAYACRHAQGFDCECACGGEFHGTEGNVGKWIDITDAFSVARGETYMSCRLLTRRST